jgi:ribonuclease HI
LAKRSEIHAFSDASDKAIGTAVFLKQENYTGEVNVSLLFAQARLSPKQATTIPRLELCAAVLSAQAMKWITRELRLNIDEIVFYTDSRVVLGYIQNESQRFYVYIANRVQIIRSISDPSQWKYVEMIHNPADIATHVANQPSSLWHLHGSTVRNFCEMTILPQRQMIMNLVLRAMIPKFVPKFQLTRPKFN